MNVKAWVQFLKESKAEFERMTWPTREQLIGGSVTVLLISAVFAIFIWISDLLSSFLVRAVTGWV